MKEFLANFRSLIGVIGSYKINKKNRKGGMYASVISITLSNDLSQLKIAGNCSHKAGNAVLESPYLKISRTPLEVRS